ELGLIIQNRVHPRGSFAGDAARMAYSGPAIRCSDLGAMTVRYSDSGSFRPEAAKDRNDAVIARDCVGRFAFKYSIDK
ncbi:hypothetical protein ABTF05_23125, partial [Acinetobacter baumannii]